MTGCAEVIPLPLALGQTRQLKKSVLSYQDPDEEMRMMVQHFRVDLEQIETKGMQKKKKKISLRESRIDVHVVSHKKPKQATTMATMTTGLKVLLIG